jgi:hypothetical protein
MALLDSLDRLQKRTRRCSNNRQLMFAQAFRTIL